MNSSDESRIKIPITIPITLWHIGRDWSMSHEQIGRQLFLCVDQTMLSGRHGATKIKGPVKLKGQVTLKGLVKLKGLAKVKGRVKFKGPVKF